MTQRTTIDQLQISQCLYDFVSQEVLPHTDLNAEKFWQNFSHLVEELTPQNKALLTQREKTQQLLDTWHKNHQGSAFDQKEYKAYLKEINYLVEEVEDFTIGTQAVDAELATLAGPQLVVPIMNARFALNAVNARWGSLYDALYGTDAISDDDDAQKGSSYNPIRGQKVIEYAREFLNSALPLSSGCHSNVINYEISGDSVLATLSQGDAVALENPKAFLGYTGDAEKPTALLFAHNGLHFEIQFDASSAIANIDKAGISDILMESALTTIMDCEDSVAAVDAEDKVIAYKNWLGLIQGSLTEQVQKGDKTFTRAMNKDRQYNTVSGQTLSLKGRSLMFVRNVGHLMTNNAILNLQGEEIPEGILDAVITSLISVIDVKNKNTLSNSEQESIYIVKPKMHGPEEVAFANLLFSRVETMLQLAPNTIKMGIMDEERRTSVNLKACVYAAKDRVVFINTGFLDRTGDEIHTSMHAGVMARKNDIKNTPWISAYENNNVDVGLSCGFSGKAQIGKGMWPIPDQMANMLVAKVAHVEAGANTAWVPSPTAATLHAMHYHRINVFELQQSLAKRTPASVDDILIIPLAENTNWTDAEISQEIDNNAQGILGYVVRWIDQGVGCSKVPDINNVGLMEDRATLRISSQHIANWLLHGICSKEQVMASLKKMAIIVDEQNKQDPLYKAMSSDFEKSIAFQAACDLVFLGTEQPSGYTEPLLHNYRLQFKAS